MMTTGDTRSTIPPTPMTLVVVGEPDDDDDVGGVGDGRGRQLYLRQPAVDDVTFVTRAVAWLLI